MLPATKRRIKEGRIFQVIHSRDQMDFDRDTKQQLVLLRTFIKSRLKYITGGKITDTTKSEIIGDFRVLIKNPNLEKTFDEVDALLDEISFSGDCRGSNYMLFTFMPESDTLHITIKLYKPKLPSIQ